MRRTQLLSIIALCVSFLTLTLAFDATYRTDTPAGTDDPSEGDDRIRETKLAVQERLDVDHWFHASAASTFDDPNTGKHRQVTYIDPNGGAVPVPGYREGITYTKDVNESLDYFDLELWWVDDDLNRLQITDQGTLNVRSSDLVDTLAHDTWFTANDANDDGTGFINLIKAGRNEDDDGDVAVLPVGARLAADTDPNEDCDLVHKKYVDNAVVPQYVKVSDVKINAAGGTFSAGAWRTRDLNTEDSDTNALCTLSGNRITLEEGTYRCCISCPAFAVSEHNARLYNVTDEETVILGTAEHASGGISSTQTRSFIVGQFTIGESKSLEVQHYTYEGVGTYGFGRKMFASSNVYTVAEFWKVD